MYHIMSDFNHQNIVWTLQRPTPAPGNKLMQLVHAQHIHATTRQNNILCLVISIEEIIVNLKTDKIGDHQAI